MKMCEMLGVSRNVLRKPLNPWR
ncbi:MAG: hypothetical protein ACLRZZ_24360 [Enterocloster sp.]